MGDGQQGNKVYVTDIGLAKEIREPMAGGSDAPAVQEPRDWDNALR
jgi:hypothetical protein